MHTVDHDTATTIRSLISRGWPLKRIVIETGADARIVQTIANDTSAEKKHSPAPARVKPQ